MGRGREEGDKTIMYTIISYRENGQVFRGGYCEGRTDSDFRLGTAVSRDDALDLLTRAIFKDMVAQNRDMNKDYDFTESAEITLGGSTVTSGQITLLTR